MKKLLLFLALLPGLAFAQTTGTGIGTNGRGGGTNIPLPVSVPNGGLGLSTITPYTLLIGNGTSAPTLLAPSATSGLPLVSNGASANPGYLNTPLGLIGYATASLPTCNASNKGAIAFTTDGTAALTFCNGTSWVSTGGTPFTMAGTGCTPTAATGDATGGSFTLAAGPCTAVTITFNGAVGMTAAHMWVCAISDQTLQNAGTWFGSWGQSASTTTTATIPIPAAAGATDVITFNCSPH